MAKKKSEPIVIKDEPLMPTTIGVYSSKKKGSLAVFVVLILFLGIAFFLPNISSYINGEDDKPVPVNPSGPNPEPDPDPNQPGMGEELEKYPIASETVIDMKDYKITEITLENGTLTVAFNGVKSTSLSNNYFELYNNENLLLGRLMIGDISLSAGDKIVRTYSAYEGATKIAITKITAQDYPAVDLNYDDTGVATLECRYVNNDKYEYNFKEDKLISFSYDHSESFLDNPNYVENVTKYQGMVNTYNSNAGIVASINTNDSGFTYILTVDLQIADYSKLINLKSYKKDTLAKEINFKNTTSGYTCTVK